MPAVEIATLGESAAAGLVDVALAMAVCGVALYAVKIVCRVLYVGGGYGSHQSALADWSDSDLAAAADPPGHPEKSLLARSDASAGPFWSAARGLECYGCGAPIGDGAACVYCARPVRFRLVVPE